MPITNEHFQPFVSVIVPVFNGAKTLPTVFAALEKQSYPRNKFEVVIVDNGSIDDTVRIAKASGHTPLTLTALPVGAARNVGADKAQGEVLAFLDSDCVPRPDWLEAGVRSINRERCITGAPYLQPDDRIWIHEAWFSQRGTGRRPVKLINSGNLFVRREDFVAIGKFSETLQSGEDSEFCLRAERLLPAIADETIQVVHLGDPSTVAEFCRREIWYGIGAWGSARQASFDKPLIATLVFALCTAMQLGGLVSWVILKSLGMAGLPIAMQLACLGTLGVFAVIILTVMYRALQYKNWKQVPRLLLLYYLYYSCRTVSFYYALTGKRYYHRR